MHLDSPRSAILSAVIFNALVIVALIPLALRGVRFRPASAAAMLRRNLLIYGARRRDRSLHRDQADRPRRRRGWGSSDATPAPPRPARLPSSSRSSLGDRLPARDHRHRAARRSRRQANGSLVERDGVVVGSSLIGQSFTRAEVLPAAPVGGRRRLRRRRSSSASNLGPSNPDLARTTSASGSPPTAARTGSPPDARAGRRGDVVGVGARPAHLPRRRADPGRARRQGARPAARRRARRSSTSTPTAARSASSASPASTCSS